jgi:hypothetical protein
MENKYKNNSKLIMIKSELKDELDSIMIGLKKKLSYSQIIRFLIVEYYKNKNK